MALFGAETKAPSALEMSSSVHTTADRSFGDDHDESRASIPGKKAKLIPIHVAS